MLYGNVVALVQTNMKRLLAYSSIAHAGYIMIGFIYMNNVSSHAVMFYLVTYILMQLGAFIVVGVFEEKFVSGTADSVRNAIDNYKGLGKTSPGLASLLSIFLFSLAGIPPFAGFWGKYYIFLAAIQNNFLWVAIIGILLSLIGVYYYIRIILLMWFYEPITELQEPRRKDFAFTAAVLSTAGLFLFGFFPEFIFRFLRLVS
jgi:NADH-quinone oxidoreductase subunit N